jgi:DNA gyrase/topoisomerase IV subunit A
MSGPLCLFTSIPRKAVTSMVTWRQASRSGCVQKKLLGLIVKESKEIATKYGRPRRTQIADASLPDILPMEALIPDQKQLIVFSEAGNIKRISDSDFVAQVRAGNVTAEEC